MAVRFLFVFVLCSWMLLTPDGKPLAYGGEPELVWTGADGVEIEVDGSDYQLRTVHLEGVAYTQILLPGGMWLPEPGRPAVPVRGTLLGVPYGARVAVTVVEAEFDEISGVLLMPVPQFRPTGSGAFGTEVEVYEPDAEFYATDGIFPRKAGCGYAYRRHAGPAGGRDILEAHPVQPRAAATSHRPQAPGCAYGSCVTSAQSGFRLRMRGVGGGFEEFYETALLNSDQARPWRGRAETGRRAQKAADLGEPGSGVRLL